MCITYYIEKAKIFTKKFFTENDKSFSDSFALVFHFAPCEMLTELNWSFLPVLTGNYYYW